MDKHREKKNNGDLSAIANDMPNGKPADEKVIHELISLFVSIGLR